MLTWRESLEAQALRDRGWTIAAIARHLDRVAQLCELIATEVRSLSRLAASAEEDRSPTTRAAVTKLPDRSAAADHEDRSARSGEDEIAGAGAVN
jgi:uncharacterized alpha-E superfamily protein